MKLAIDASSLLHPHTGVGTFTQELLRELSRRSNIEISIIAFGRKKPQWKSKTSLPNIRTIPGWLYTSRLRWLWPYLSIPRFEWLAGPTDVFHGPNYVVPPTKQAAIVVSVHDVGFEHRPPQCIPGALAYRKTVRDAILRGAWIHTDSEFVAEEVRSIYPVDKAKVVTISPGVRLCPPGPHPAPGPPYILALGTSDSRKNLDILVAAFTEVGTEYPELRLVHAGPEGDAAETLHRAIINSPHRDRIVQLGWVNAPAKAALIHEAAVVAYPSRYEGFGFVPLEAMLAGKPVVTTPVSSIPEVAGEAALYADVGDISGLANALLRALSDSKLRVELQHRGEQQAAKFTWEKSATAFLALYNQAATEKSAST